MNLYELPTLKPGPQWGLDKSCKNRTISPLVKYVQIGHEIALDCHKYTYVSKYKCMCVTLFLSLGILYLTVWLHF